MLYLCIKFGLVRTDGPAKKILLGMSKKRSSKISTFGSRLTTVISVTLVLLILGSLAMVLTASHAMTEQVRSNMGFIVKMSPSATDVQVNAVKQALAKAPFTDRYVFASADDILRQESELMGEDIAALVDENPYGAEFDVKVRPRWAVGDSIEHLAAIQASRPGVEEVVTETAVVNNINSLMNRLSWALLVVGLALLAISVVLINNSVSLAVYARRFIIYTMKLVGATGAFIRRPFLMAGLAAGAIAGVAAAGLLCGLRAWLAAADPIARQWLPWSTMALIMAGVVLAGVLICGTASAVATNRYLRSRYDNMFR